MKHMQGQNLNKESVNSLWILQKGQLIFYMDILKRANNPQVQYHRSSSL